jgi:hypothetical protein
MEHFKKVVKSQLSLPILLPEEGGEFCQEKEESSARRRRRVLPGEGGEFWKCINNPNWLFQL